MYPGRSQSCGEGCGHRFGLSGCVGVRSRPWRGWVLLPFFTLLLVPSPALRLLIGVPAASDYLHVHHVSLSCVCIVAWNSYAEHSSILFTCVQPCLYLTWSVVISWQTSQSSVLDHQFAWSHTCLFTESKPGFIQPLCGARILATNPDSHVLNTHYVWILPFSLFHPCVWN